MKIPLRVDFGGGWLDVPKYAREGAFIVNCAITPMVSLEDWPYEKGGGLGGSAAYALLQDKDPVNSELELGVGWQDPAVIMETGLCVWRSGDKPILHTKMNPDFLNGRMALYHTGKNHETPNITNNKRDFDKIIEAGLMASTATKWRDLHMLASAVRKSYEAQLGEGMDELPPFGELAKKYCGGGWGGYALYLFEGNRSKELLAIEPYMK